MRNFYAIDGTGIVMKVHAERAKNKINQAVFGEGKNSYLEWAETPSSGTPFGFCAITRGWEMLSLDEAYEFVEDEFSDLYRTISYFETDAVENYRIVLRYRHIIGELNDRQLTVLKLCRMAEVCGLFQNMSKEEFGNSHMYAKWYYAGAFRCEAEPTIDHMVVGRYGDHYEENFNSILEAAIEQSRITKHDFYPALFSMARSLASFEGDNAISDFARVNFTNDSGWATRA
ncbi:hypothetical protein NS226_13620 [Aureimonas ureilytica]|uniref:Uncharacterized protein n=1 Tax=Aureimonas ureilytica TaxID=401562 RepID=A0A175R776_9HYPH|nr:hypothetical protein NS226_13620 [Aureimonas ureilytica]